MFFFKQLLLVFPGRMALGKLGMWMVRVGEALQLHYAGWNKKFRMKVELLEQTQWAQFHVSEKVTDQQTLSFSSPTSQIDKQPPFVQQLFAIQGVVAVILYPYYVAVERGKVFTWEEIAPKIENVLIEAFAK